MASTSAPVACAFDQSVYLFLKGPGSKIYHQWMDAYHNWSGLKEVGYTIKQSGLVSATTQTDGAMEACAVGKTLLLTHRHVTNLPGTFYRIRSTDWMVTAYTGKDFTGRKRIFDLELIPYVGQGEGMHGWNDAIRSIRVPEGCVVRLYEGVNYNLEGGNKVAVLEGHMTDLEKAAIGSQTSSMTISCKCPSQYAVDRKVVLYSRPNYFAKHIAFPQVQDMKAYHEIPDLSLFGLKDNVGSIILPYGCTVEMFEYPDFKGYSVSIGGSLDNTTGYLKKVGSMIIYCDPQ